VVFTLPAALGAIAYQNKAKLYGLAAAETLTTIAGDPKHLGADIGVTAVLHTWGQNLQHHPHVHCIVPGGGLSPHDERWIACRNGFFPTDPKEANSALWVLDRFTGAVYQCPAGYDCRRVH
jgi:hypothetical protein